MFGHVREYKGVDIAVRAVRVLLDQGVRVHLTIVGRFWVPLEETMQLVQQLGLESHVRVRDDYVTEAELEAHLSSCSLVLAPYLEDTLSAVVPTALAAGRPVIASAVKGILQQLRPGVDAVTVTPRDHIDLARGVVEGLANLNTLADGASSRTDSWLEVASVAMIALGLAEPPISPTHRTPEDQR
jgi:glycosyltransferase involved in cell wall biosynthesis